jgi:hypothetical protein
MTESWAATLPMVAVPRLPLAALRELRGLVDAQLVSSLPSSETTRMGGGDGETATARTSAAARSAGAPSKETRYQRLDAVTRAEVTGLLKLLLDECSAALAKPMEAADE